MTGDGWYFLQTTMGSPTGDGWWQDTFRPQRRAQRKKTMATTFAVSPPGPPDDDGWRDVNNLNIDDPSNYNVINPV